MQYCNIKIEIIFMSEEKNNSKETLQGQSYSQFANPDEVISQLEIKKGMVVADFGCGAGYFSLAVAKTVGEEGVVYALDVLPAKLESVESQAKGLGLTNIITQRVNLEKTGGAKLSNDTIDLVIMKDMLFQNQNKQVVMEEAKRVLKPKGRLLVVEWKPEDASIGPEVNMRISKEAIIETASLEKLCFLKEVEVGSFHYGLIFAK